MIAFITNMQNASNVTGDNVTARALIDKWIADRGLDFEDADAFADAHAITNVNTGNGVTNLDAALPDGTTLSVYTQAVATGGVKGACLLVSGGIHAEGETA